MRVLQGRVHVHSEWPWLSHTDSTNGRVNVFVCSVLPCLSQIAGETSDSGAAHHSMRPRLLSRCSILSHNFNSCRKQWLWAKTSDCLSVSLCQCVTAKALARSPPLQPSVTTLATPWRPASRCSSRCLREDWTTATVCCHLTPKWWVNTPGPSWPQIR